MNNNNAITMNNNNTITMNNNNNINMQSIAIVLNENQEMIENDEKNSWLVQDQITQDIFFLEKSFFKNNNVIETPATQNNNHEINEINENSIDSTRTYWSREQILQLIEQYKEHEDLFKSTTIKNEAVWKLISTKIKNRTAEQCKNKFKYLKIKYMEKKDNMGEKATGARALKFEYFNEMDEIFQSKANVKPLAIASTSRGEENVPPLNPLLPPSNIGSDNEEIVGKKGKRKRTTDSSYKEIETLKEEGRMRRHNEKMLLKREILEALKDLKK